MATRHFALTLLFACACARVQRDTATPEATAQPAALPALRVADDVVDAPSEAPPPDAQHTASGLAYVVLTQGTGTEHPTPGAEFTAHYVAWTASDGAKFDDSYARGEPFAAYPGLVIPGWGEAIQLMVVGEKTRFWIPEHLAYAGKPNMPAGTLIFEIELIGFTPKT